MHNYLHVLTFWKKVFSALIIALNFASIVEIMLIIILHGIIFIYTFAARGFIYKSSFIMKLIAEFTFILFLITLYFIDKFMKSTLMEAT